MSPARVPGPDWEHFGWHYKFLQSLSGLQNRALRVRARGLEHVPREGGVLLVANHCAYWDGIFLQTALGRPVGPLVRRELFNTRLGRWFFAGGGAIPVDRDGARNPEALNAAATALRDGRVIAIFPEGRRSGGREAEGAPFLQAGPVGLLSPKSGVGRLALATGVPVVPIGILTDRFWPRGHKFPDVREPIYIHAGAPIVYEKDDAPDAPRRVAHELMHQVGALLEEAHEARERGDKWARP